MKAIHRSIALLCFLVCATPAWADTYRILNTTVTHPGPTLTRTERLVQIGTDPLNRIGITRIESDEARHGRERSDHPLLLMASTGFTAKFYEGSDTGRYINSWVGRLASKGFDVWVVDDRTSRDLGPGTCEGSVDCSIMSTWDLAARVADAEFALTLLTPHHRHEKPIIGGFVGGAIAASAVVNAHPHAFSGLLSWQGVMYTTDPQIRAYNEPFCQLLEGALAQGVFFDNSTEALLPFIQALRDHLNDPAPAIPGLPPNLTYLQTLVLLLTVHADSPNAPTPQWINAVGDYHTGTFQFADLGLVLRFTDQLTLYQPIAMFRDFICGIARGETTYRANLGQFRGRAFFLGTDLAMAPLIPDTAALFTHASGIKLQLESGIGEDDPIWMRDFDRIRRYDRPITRWMRSVFNDERDDD